ncbi:bifunctional 2-C-methyl-D-erythritol 4-phosphate cytidylyltransferase/2-C-methyl-D-erythritol 2,4-cyclodiphosphate synthase [Sphingorhabdus sp. YGSMI21]|uniref:bifunctional 2-C-methyl-D-erythritol 4-phosphate cytidylyltransferase/2-C-methyl-D-erythritol 2,4-cyclodiphosphate synthase n=1 Tax=Sphingorhabdus sp. YGSMI21 TaxID=2077182 RepID=UPI000C1DDD25|nr:bifunctional 2-C-methyl-D-erythritol 4-phosphate cytidylyltransferase/2-C-methyl-D-erythritol 2,4-cyclodiphosphate synthase [Sphingorhabdus sp. YGSMI21]ATW04687.1 bifunctional 2-C-methyl-D-erythritol 4-phosphate cytidylyltransferase/2-C-methyl-D-erythritol 2,4-cyclodiphosphate synthase [Sphingorhabdus sp. YGSMI21]
MVAAPDPSQQTHALIVAAGVGARAGLGIPKQYEIIGGKPMVRHSVERLSAHPDIDRIWIVVAAGQEELLNQTLAPLSSYKIVIGGATRQQSVYKGLRAILQAGGARNILVHDAARPFLPDSVIDRLLDRLETASAAIPVLPCVDTMVQLTGDRIDRIDRLDRTVDRNSLWRVQTPQAFDFGKLVAAHENFAADRDASDDAQIFQAAGHAVSTVEGVEALKKYTLPGDFAAEGTEDMRQTRTGMGYDVHRLAPGEDLWLGGVKIDHDKGLAGHSDADVLLHALTDALLGTIAAGDIGDHFPPSDPQWRGAASSRFVEHAVSLIAENGGSIQNVDMTIICEAPKIKPHRDAIRENIATLLNLGQDRVSVKATTTEGLGFAGRKEGIAAQAIATIILEG